MKTSVGLLVFNPLWYISYKHLYIFKGAVIFFCLHRIFYQLSRVETKVAVFCVYAKKRQTAIIKTMHRNYKKNFYKMKSILKNGTFL
jgi:hypothetical protein